LGIDHPNHNTSKVQDTRFNKQDLLKGTRRIGGGGGGDGGLDIVPPLLHQSNLDSKFISLIVEKLIATKFVIAMSNKAEC
jgi:hypothetical protein